MTEIKLYKVGGWVRDKLLGVKSNDLDYAVEAPSFEAMRDYVAARGTIFLESPEFLTIRAKDASGEAVDFVLCRKDGEYTDGRRPDSVEPGTIFDDLARRDFTMNAIAMDDAGNLIDPYGGQADIEFGIIKCVGNADDRFNEDALRMLRAFRFVITKGFTCHRDVIAALDDPQMIAKLASVSQERIREEMQKCFSHDTHRTLVLLSEIFHLRNFVFNRTDLWLNVSAKKR
jgi:tRNA nucleotidyltransferase (CCA-adding enzyme)